MDLAAAVHSLAKRLPEKERFALGQQMLKAAIAIPSRIAQGHSTGGEEFVQLLYAAGGARSELRTLLFLCDRFEYLDRGDIESAHSLLDEISAMLSSLIEELSA